MDVKVIVKEYWPYILGGVVGLVGIVYLNNRGGDSGGTYAPSGVSGAALNAGYGASSLAATSQQAQIQTAQFAAQTAREVSLTVASGEAAKNAAMGGAILAQQLQQPIITALNAATAENIATVNTAAAIGVAGFVSASETAKAAAIAGASFSDGIARATESVAMASANSSASIGSQQLVGSNGAGWNAVGNIATTAIPYLFSDERLKENIKPAVDEGVNFDAIEFVSFDFKPEFEALSGGLMHMDCGVIAQQLGQVNPAWVGTDPDSGLMYIRGAHLLLSMAQEIQKLRNRVLWLEGKAA